MIRRNADQQLESELSTREKSAYRLEVREALVLPFHRGQNVNRSNILYLVIGVLALAVVIIGYELYQDRKQPDGVQINVGPNGMSIEKK